MLKIDRHSYILEELKNKQLVRVSKLAKDMKVTEMTIRRDLQELEDCGLLQREGKNIYLKKISNIF